MAKAHALIIDDNAENIEVLARLLAINDVTYTAVQDANQLESIVENASESDVVFLDIEMPKHTGYEIFTALRDQIGKSLSIVAYSVHQNEITVARKRGFNGFLAKPLDPQLFPSQLVQILNGEAVWDTL